jgi:hypothetical protein
MHDVRAFKTGPRIDMPSYVFYLLYGSCALLISLPAIAQTKPAAKEDATRANAAVPASMYQSAFEGYQPYREQSIAGWREVNDEVGRVGGHAGMFGGTAAAPAKEATGQQPQRSAPAAPGHHTAH